MIGLPFASFKSSGLDDLMARQEATGIKEASLFGSSKIKLVFDKKGVNLCEMALKTEIERALRCCRCMARLS